jgi:hypothetical protein
MVSGHLERALTESYTFRKQLIRVASGIADEAIGTPRLACDGILASRLSRAGLL